MNTPFEIKIVKNNIAEDYGKNPFRVFINDKEIENVKRFSIDLDKDNLAHDNGNEIICKDWTYQIEYYHDCVKGLVSKH